jgi:hypothetical protein
MTHDELDLLRWADDGGHEPAETASANVRYVHHDCGDPRCTDPEHLSIREVAR